MAHSMALCRRLFPDVCPTGRLFPADLAALDFGMAPRNIFLPTVFRSAARELFIKQSNSRQSSQPTARPDSYSDSSCERSRVFLANALRCHGLSRLSFDGQPSAYGYDHRGGAGTRSV